MDQLKAYPFDLIFEDQIGARGWLTGNGLAFSDSTAYYMGWIDHTRKYQSRLLMTERGFDRLMETETGFHGSVLMDSRPVKDSAPATDDRWGPGTWQSYPLIPMIARNKVLLYQHNLDERTMTADKETFTWNLAFGLMLSYDLYTGGVNNPWLKIVGDFQRRVLSTYADENLEGYSLDGSVSLSTFPSATVMANWDPANAYSLAGFTLPPSGVMVASASGSRAGIFTTYNGLQLSSGDHYIIEERGRCAITVRQSYGSDTPLRIRLLPRWNSASPVEVWALTSGNQWVGSVTPTSTANGVTFTYRAQLSGKDVDHYLVTVPGACAYLPVTLR